MACNAILGIEEPIERSAKTPDATVADVVVSDAPAADASGDAGDGAAPIDGSSPSDCTMTPNSTAIARRICRLRALSNGACAVLDNGRAYCWGGFYAGLGDTAESAPKPVVVDTPRELHWGDGSVMDGVVDVTEVRFGGLCALRWDGKHRYIHCWGTNADGQLGYGGPVNYGATPGGKVRVSETAALEDAVSIADSCALHSGQVECWGRDFFGERGVNGATVDNAARPVLASLPSGGVTALVGVRRLESVGDHVRLVELDDGSILGWGYSEALGIDTTTPPQPLDSCDNQSCGAALPVGRMLIHGRLGSAGAPRQWSSLPADMPLPGTPFGIARTADASVVWGPGAIASRNYGVSAIPGESDAILAAQMTSRQGNKMTRCIVQKSERGVYCRGANLSGRAAVDPVGSDVDYPTEPIKGLTEVSQLVAGAGYFCALLDQPSGNLANQVKCWGDDRYRVLGPKPEPDDKPSCTREHAPPSDTTGPCNPFPQRIPLP